MLIIFLLFLMTQTLKGIIMNKLSIADSIWDVILENYESFHKQFPELKFHAQKKTDFEKLYQKEYSSFMTKYMNENTKSLDAHKQAAIIIICCLELNIIDASNCSLSNAKEICLIPQIIAINAALSYMLYCLNQTLAQKHIHKQIDRYYLPITYACDTPYEKSMCRILLYEQNDNNLHFNILELADRLFLLEYINLLQYGIEPSMLK